MTHSENPPPIRPSGRSVTRLIRIGGMTKAELLAELENRGIELNDYARALFAHENFTTSKSISHLTAVEKSVGDLGFAQGATTPQIHGRAAELGLDLCPLELGPHLRLQFLDQPEGSLGYPPSKNRAPPGSITVASRPITEDDTFPQGFYLRRINGALWLRGYCSGPENLWRPEDRLIFCRPQDAPEPRRPAGSAHWQC